MPIATSYQESYKRNGTSVPRLHRQGYCGHGNASSALAHCVRLARTAVSFVSISAHVPSSIRYFSSLLAGVSSVATATPHQGPLVRPRLRLISLYTPRSSCTRRRIVYIYLGACAIINSVSFVSIGRGITATATRHRVRLSRLTYHRQLGVPRLHRQGHLLRPQRPSAQRPVAPRPVV